MLVRYFREPLVSHGLLREGNDQGQFFRLTQSRPIARELLTQCLDRFRRKEGEHTQNNDNSGLGIKFLDKIWLSPIELSPPLHDIVNAKALALTNSDKSEHVLDLLVSTI